MGGNIKEFIILSLHVEAYGRTFLVVGKKRMIAKISLGLCLNV